MTDTNDKPSLKDIADQDGADKDTEQGAPAPGEISKSAKKSGGGFVWFMLLLVIAGGSVAAGWPYIGPKVEPVITDVRALLGLTPRPTQARLPSETARAVEPVAAPVVEVPAVEAPAVETPAVEIATVVEPVAEVVAEVAPEPVIPTPVVPTPPTFAVDTTAISTRLDALENNSAATAELARALTALNTQLATISDRLQALEDGTRADPTAPAQALVLGVTQLRSRLTGDSPFAAELAALQSIAGNDAVVVAALGRLKPHGEVGVPSEAALTARFTKVANAIITARSSSEAGGWLGTVKDSLGGLVTVRRTDPAAITDAVERAVAIAEAALELGELDEAVNALSILQGPPGDACAAWLGDARARVDAEAALEDLHRHALTVLSSAGGV